MACGTWKCNPGLGWHMCGLMEINTCIAACAWKWCKMMMIMTTTRRTRRTRRTRTRTMMMMMMMMVMLTMKIIIIVIATLKNWGFEISFWNVAAVLIGVEVAPMEFEVFGPQPCMVHFGLAAPEISRRIFFSLNWGPWKGPMICWELA